MAAFQEDSSTSVFTTRQVMIGNSPIVYVVHDEEGDWQFFGADENVQDTDVMIVSLQQVVQHDPTVLEIANLPKSTVATREDANAPWMKSSHPSLA